MTDYETDSVILTGGDPTYSVAERYGHSGLLETLPALVQGRKAHGCDSYIRHGTRVRNVILSISSRATPEGIPGGRGRQL